jgi:hypothetical protein
MVEPIFFYSELCPICPAVLVDCLKYFADKGVRLIVRKPYLSERSKLPGLPALFLPAEFCQAAQPYVLIGEDIPSWLTELDERLVKEVTK